MKHIRKIMLLVAVITCFITVGYSVKGNDSMIYENIFEGALTEENLATYFDVNRGKPEMEWHQDYATMKSGYLFSVNDISASEYTLTLDIYAEGNECRFRMDLGRATGKSTLAQISLDSRQNAISVYNGVGATTTYDYDGVLTSGKWYQLKIVASGNQLCLYVDGKLSVQLQDQQGFSGKFAIRSLGDAIRFRNLSCYEAVCVPVTKQNQTVGVLTGYDKLVLPGIEQDITYIPADTSMTNLRAEVSDSSNVVYENINLNNGENGYCFSYIPRGSAGKQTITIYSGDLIVGVAEVYLDARTTVITEDESFNNFYNTLIRQVITRNQPVYTFDDQTLGAHTFKMHMSWLRDHIHMMEAGIYWQTGYKEVLDFWIDYQHEDGFFYEMIVVADTDAWKSYTEGSDEKFYKDMGDGNYILRFEIEADIEYLVVDAVYMAWQTTGDAQWMQSKIPNLEKALKWIMTNPERWSKEYGLPIRGSSVDTYDFTYGHNTGNRRVVWWEEGMDWGTAMAIFHGDCTGFAQACNQLAEMYRTTGNTEKAKYWEKVSDDVMRNLTAATWNGNYFAHMVQVHPKLEDLPADWQEDLSGDWTRLSYSNTCALNRDVLTQEQAASIINSFKALRDNPPKQETTDGYAEDTLFAEWVTIYPSYRKKEYVKYDPGAYINGSIAPFCGGELANGCFEWGYPDYGYDCISRLKSLLEKNGALKFFYQQNGEIYYYSGKSSGGPDAWGAAVTHNAIIEGLAGFSSSDILMQNVTLSPSWTVTDYDKTYTSVSYGENNKYMAYTAEYNKDAQLLSYDIIGDSRIVTLKLLMPEGKIPKSVKINGYEMQFEARAQGNSAYAVLSYEKKSNTSIDTVEVSFVDGKLPGQEENNGNSAVLNPWQTPDPNFKYNSQPANGKNILKWALLAVELIAALAIAMGTAVFFAKKSIKK